jgi:hypothetical protein
MGLATIATAVGYVVTRDIADELQQLMTTTGFAITGGGAPPPHHISTQRPRR